MRKRKKRGPAKDKKTRIPKKYLSGTKGSRRSELASLIKRISKLYKEGKKINLKAVQKSRAVRKRKKR